MRDPDIAGRNLFVIGDSHAAAYSTLLKQVSQELGITVHKLAAPGCAIVSLLAPMDQTPECKAELTRFFHEIKKTAKPNDIIFFACLRTLRLCTQWERDNEAAATALLNSKTGKEYLQNALEDADKTIQKLGAMGINVMIDAPKPVFRAPPFRCADWFNKMNPVCADGFSVSREFLLNFRQPVMESIKTLQARHQNFFVWDPLPILCKTENCSAFDGDKPMFFDGDHLSAHGNRVLAPSFKNKLLELWRTKQ